MKQALYRKYRPQTFDQVIGQDNIINILKNQIKNDKISHAYIFSGTRGTGKTSTAKIFAKAVNCLNPVDGSPCNECERCLAIDQEKSMDIVEMDAASNRRIDDIRQLRDQVIYPPTIQKYKVYIIDEAHMITNEGFNALLKIMEEPPKHLIFILATTEIEKIPDTILSRAQRFEFKSLGNKDIVKQIDTILTEEGIEVESRAVDVIANIASGAMRDALSTLDQVISMGKDKIKAEDVYDLLGIFSDQIKVDYAQAVFSKDIKGLLKLIDEELNKGKNPNNFIKEIVTFFKDLIYVKIGLKNYDFNGLVENVSLDQLVNSVDILLEYEETMKKSDSQDLLFRVASIRLIDYMPRKVLESKISNMEERLLYIEENGVVTSSNDSHTKNNLRNQTNKDENPFTIDNTGSFLQSQEEESDVRDSQETINDENQESEQEILNSDEVEEDKDTLEVKSLQNQVTEEQNEGQSENQENKDDIPEIVEDSGLDSEDSQNNQSQNGDKEKVDVVAELLEILRVNYPPTNLLLEGLVKAEHKLDQIILYIDSEHFSMSKGMKFFFDRAEEDLKEKLGHRYHMKCMIYKEKNKEVDSNLEKLQDLFDNKIQVKDKK